MIDIGVAGVIGADRITDGEPLYEGGFSPGLDLRGDVYGPGQLPRLRPVRAALPLGRRLGRRAGGARRGDRLRPRSASLGLVALGRRLRDGRRGPGARAGRSRFAWVACPWTLYTMNANANDALVAALGVGALLALRSPPARGALVALAAAAKFGSAALAPLFATADRRAALARRAIVLASPSPPSRRSSSLPFVPDGGLREIYDRTLGYQATRSSPFSVWGQAPSLDFLQPVARAVAVALALGVAFYPRVKTPVQIAALAAAVTIAVQLTASHWFYFYVVWFLPFVLVAAFAAQGRIRRSVVRSSPELRRADDDLVAGLQPDARVAGAADAGRGAGGDDVAGLERHQAREVGDQLRDREDQVGGASTPASARRSGRARSRSRRAGPASSGVTIAGPARRRAVEDLARHPLRGRELEVARGEVVEQRVAGEVVDRVGLGDVLGAAADDERDLGLVVDLLARRRQRDRRAVGAQGVAELGEEGRARGRLHAAPRRRGRGS